MTMIKSFSNKLLQYLVKTGTIDKDEDVLAYYRYGLEITISSIVNIILILLIGICSHHFYESIAFLICFVTLRQFTGGYHANTYFKCNFLFSILYIALLIAYDLTIKQLTYHADALMLVFSIVTFASECPIEHNNKPLSDIQKKRNKKLSVMLGLLYGSIGVISQVLSYDVGVIFLYTLVLISLLVIVATFQRIRREGYE